MTVAAQTADVASDPRGESTRTRILDSAEYLFSEHGSMGRRCAPSSRMPALTPPQSTIILAPKKAF